MARQGLVLSARRPSEPYREPSKNADAPEMQNWDGVGPLLSDDYNVWPAWPEKPQQDLQLRRNSYSRS